VKSARHSPDDAEGRASIIHREVLQLGMLIVVAVSAFLVTRAVAESNHDTSLRDAAEWYRRGQGQIEGGRVDDAIDSIRRATVRARNDKRYALALAQALALNGEHDAARGALLVLRESAPEDPDINLQLARIAAGQPNVTEALRFYHSALYAPWPVEQADARRRIRFELVRFLLNHDQASRALAELLAINTDLPDDSGLRVAAPMTSVFMIFEITQDYQILVPLMVANLLSFVISRRYQPVPVYHALLLQDGVHLPSAAGQAPATTTAQQVMRADALFVSPAMSVEQAWLWSKEQEAPAYLVGTPDRLAGAVTRAQLDEWRASEEAGDALSSVVADSFVHAHPDHSIEVVLERLSESGGLLPVVSRTAAKRVEGVITCDSILDSWASATPRQTDRARPRDTDPG
jgi:predicted transcriptional regulator